MERGGGQFQRKLQAFIRRLRKWGGSIVPLLHYEEVPVDNNGLERGIGTVKVKRKIWGQLRTPRG
ncbi:MAG: IS66 family transposase, partial [Treponema sp.]|nr:IS66 family transposase [Treponema sp.]